MFLARKRHQVFELPYEHAQILPHRGFFDALAGRGLNAYSPQA
jgi:hypothetical protein